MLFEENVKAILNGLATKEHTKPSDVDSTELTMGIKVEHEHTNDHTTAEKIALDHLTEDPKYYRKLKAAKL